MARVEICAIVAREIELLMAEAAALNAAGPQFVIHHRFCKTALCAPGESVDSVALQHRGRLFFMKLSSSELLLFESLSRLRWSGTTATLLSAFMRKNSFFKKHGHNAGGKIAQRGVSRKAIRVHIGRIRVAMTEVFAEAGLAFWPEDVLRTERTGYRLRASCETVHIDATGRAVHGAVDVDDIVADAAAGFHIVPTPSTALNQAVDFKRVGSY